MGVRGAGRAGWAVGVVIAVAVALAGCGARSGAGKATPGPVGTSAVPSPGAGGSATGAAMWFVSLRMVSSGTGWALRWTRNPGVVNAGVLAPARTTDGGRTWDDVTPVAARPLLTPTATSGTLFALGAERAWFAVSRTRAHRPPRTVVFATSNGGRTWRASPAFGSLGSPRVLYFTGPEHGWLMADLGAAMGSDAVAVFATSDGGSHWSLVARTPPLAGPGRGAGGLPLRCDKSGIVATGAATGWITGDCTAGAPLVEVTHDGGRTWAPQPLPALGACSQGSQADPPQFFGTAGYLAVSCFPRPALLVSHDGGASWSRAALPANAGAFPRIEFVDARHGVLIPAGPQGVLGNLVYRTSDGGQVWQAVHPRTRAGLPGTSLDFVTATTGFAWVPGADATSGTVPPLCRTSDAGRTWACFVPQVVRARQAG